MVIDELEGCLELLLELQAYAGPASIEWPEGADVAGQPGCAGQAAAAGGSGPRLVQRDGTVALDEEQVLEMRFLLDRLDRAKGRFRAARGMAASSR